MDGIKIYEYLWGNKFPVKTQKTWCSSHKKCSENSYSFDIGIDYKNVCKDDKDKICSSIKKIFEIKSDSFDKKFEEACSGSGNELRKITTLHSSSLCALLFFYNVSEKHTMEFKEIPNVIFNEVYFEFKTHVINSNRPSNMDVVLVGENKKGKKVYLFLESKFSEYLSNGKAEVSKEYLSKKLPIYYDDNLLKELGLELEPTKPKVGFYNLYGSPESCYADGIKQMISHFIGIHNYLKGNKYQKENRELEISKGCEIYLGEILFDFNDFGKPYFKSYSEKYSKLAKILNEKISENDYPCKFKVLKNVLNYNDLKKYKEKESKIYNYYW